MRTLPARIINAKNRIDNPNPWLAILDIVVPTTPPLNLYVVNNSENITFVGQEYTALPFSISLPKQSSAGEMHSTELTLEDVAGALRRYIKLLNGGYGTTVRLRVINTEYMDTESDYSDLDVDFELLDVSSDQDGNLSFSLGAPNLMRQSFPPFRYLANNCAWASRYGGYECKASAATLATYPTCAGTLTDCRERSNSANFGGHPGLSDTAMRMT